MKLTTGILAVTVMTGGLWAQNPNIINNVQNKLNTVQQKQAEDSDAALEGVGTPAAKPAPGAPAPAVKPAVIPGAKPAPASKPASAAPAANPAKTSAAPAAKPAVAAAPTLSQSNKLEHVNVIRNADTTQIEISSREAVTAKVSKLSSPARVVVELPATAMATSQTKIPVDNAGVKGVRIGMDGKTPPTTSVVVDLEQAFAYELTQGAGNKLVLTLHTQAAVAAKNTPAPVPAKTSAPAPKLQTVAAKPVVAPAVVAPAAKSTAAKSTPAPLAAKASAPAPKPQTVTAKPAVAPPAAAPVAKSNPVAASPSTKSHDAFLPKKETVASPAVAKVAAPKPAAKSAAPATKIAAQEKPTAAGKTADAPSKTAEAPKPPKPEEKKWAMTGKRDPFFSPVVQQTSGPGCSTGKKCLDIGQINVRGVVKSEAGFIAVVTNSMNKAYFLHENDPVFNGYVLRITGDSVVFSETVQDKLGKPLTREVVKRLTTPAV